MPSRISDSALLGIVRHLCQMPIQVKMPPHRDGLQSHRSRFTEHQSRGAQRRPLLNLLSQQSRRIGELGELLAALIHPHRQSYQSILHVRFRAGLVVPVTD